MEITKKLDELINLANSIRPLSLDSENLEYFNDKSAYEFGHDLGERLNKEEYIPTLEQAIEIYHTGRISKLSADMEILLHVCTNTLQESTPGVNFSVKSLEIHVRVSARIAAYYTAIQLYLRHPSITSEKIIAKLGQEFYDSLMKAIGSALSLKYVQQYIHAWNILNFIEETAKKIEDKVSSSVIKDANKINRIIDIAKCEPFEIRTALAIAVKYEKEFRTLEELQYTFNSVDAEIAQAEKNYDLNKLAEFKYGIVPDLQNKIATLEDEIKIKATQYLLELDIENTEKQSLEASVKKDRLECINDIDKTINHKSELIYPNLDIKASTNQQEQKELLQTEDIFRKLQHYLSDSCGFSLDKIMLDSTVFFGSFTNFKPISSSFWGSLSSNNSSMYDAPENSLGMDVLDGQELILFIESEFDIEILDDDGKVVTIEELINIILKLRCDD